MHRKQLSFLECYDIANIQNGREVLLVNSNRNRLTIHLFLYHSAIVSTKQLTIWSPNPMRGKSRYTLVDVNDSLETQENIHSASDCECVRSHMLVVQTIFLCYFSALHCTLFCAFLAKGKRILVFEAGLYTIRK